MSGATSATPDARDRLLRWYRILALAFVVFLLLFVGARVGLLRADRQNEASRLFLTLRGYARSAMEAYEAGDGTSFAATMGEVARSEENLLLLAVHEKDRAVYYFFARDKSVFYTPPQPTSDMLAVPPYRAPRLTTTQQESTLEMQGSGRQVTVEALYRVLTPGDIHRVGSEVLYILLVFLIATATVLLVSAALGQRAAAVPPVRPAPPAAAENALGPAVAPAPAPAERTVPRPPGHFAQAPPGLVVEPPGVPAAGGPAVRPAPSPDDMEPILTIDDLEDNIEEPADLQPSAPPPSPAEPAKAQVRPPESEAAKDPTPPHRAMFREDTGLVHRELLEPRLRSEIERAAASDQDVVLAFIAIDNLRRLNRPEAVAAAVGQRVRETFPFRDLLFHYEDGFAVIVPDTNLDRALLRLEDFRAAVTSTPIEGQRITVSVGIGARNGRLISDEVLMREAGQSLAKAIRDGRNQIVAFRADPDKFRRILAT